MTKKDIIFTLIISLAITGLFFLVWLNLGIFTELQQYYWILLIIFPLLAIVFIYFIQWLDRKIKWNVWRVAKFAMVGLLNTLLDFGILNLLSYLTKIYFGLGLAIFNIIAFLVANLNSFFWNRNWTFEVGEGNRKMEFMKFFGVSLGGLVINTIILLLSLELFKIILPAINPQIGENLGKLIAVLFSKFWNYFGYKWLFKSSDKENQRG